MNAPRKLPLVVVCAMVACLCRAQAFTFEVASVRVADREPPSRPFPAGGQIAGGPGTNDPTRLTYSWVGDPAQDLFSALDKQLGLKLEKSKTQLDVVVIDHMDKRPSEN